MDSTAHDETENPIRYRFRHQATDAEPGIFQFRKGNGLFDYDRYRAGQLAVQSTRKEPKVREQTVRCLAEYINRSLGQPTFGLCHGSGGGFEQKWFRTALECDVIGTDIAEWADLIPDTINWDFHEAKTEWRNSADFIYSNSLQHSYDPERCLNAWMSCLKLHGLCLLEYTAANERISEISPFSAPASLMPYLVLMWGKGRYSVREIIDLPNAEAAGSNYACCLVLQRND
ncbi:MAG: hypothetical protein ACPGVU_05695 [Limisphaerales bacterium]